MKILYFDDDESDLFAAGENFAAQGINLFCTSSITEAREWIDQGDWDLLICDLVMTLDDGLILAKEVSARDLGIPIVLTSGMPTLRSFEHYGELKNHKGFILKPVTPEGVRKLMEKEHE